VKAVVARWLKVLKRVFGREEAQESRETGRVRLGGLKR
jgi:hypothetical protein